MARSSLVAATGAQAAAFDAEVEARMRDWLPLPEGGELGALLAGAPSVDVHRHLSRLLARAIRPREAVGLAVTLFAIPVVVVTACRQGEASSPFLDGVLPDAALLSALLRQHGALSGNRTLSLSSALVGAASLDVPALGALLAAARLPDDGSPVPLALPPLPIEVGIDEAAHLRFLVGTALAGPAADLLRETGTGPWATPLAGALSKQLATRGVTVLALPRAIQSLATAIRSGRIAQREISAQLFASNALRRLRAGFGEPTVVISAHRLSGGRGEIRVSLSTPFEPREAEGFRCPLYPFDRVAEVAVMLVDLMRDCRVGDIRVVQGVHTARDPDTGLPVLFKPGTIPPGIPVALH